MVDLVCFIVQRGLDWAAHEAGQQGKLLKVARLDFFRGIPPKFEP